MIAVMLKLLFILPCLIIMFQPLNAKVEAHNSNFRIETLQDFFPGKNSADLDAKYGKAELMSKEKGILTFKYFVKDRSYKFPVIVNVNGGIIEDFLARLPSYFLHDVFFQSIINKYGKQTTYNKVGEEAHYVWQQSPLKHIYSAACTITCFPVFYAVEKEEKKFLSILDRMKKGHPL
jgi:hypothetical protein